MPELAAHLERVARELAEQVGAAHKWHSSPCPGCEKNIAVVAAALAACAREARNDGIEAVCGLVAAQGDELFFGPFSIGHNPKRVQQEHTMLVELIRALKRERAVGEKAGS